MNNIPFIDLKAQQAVIRTKLDTAIAKVLDSGMYIMGSEISELEARLADFSGAKYVLSCSSGTSALYLCLMAIGVNKNDAVFVPSFTFIATAESVLLAGATPVVVDVKEDTFLMDADDLQKAIADAKAKGLNPKVVIPVDLFGLPADYDRIGKIAKENNMVVISDNCQGYGSVMRGKKAGTFGDLSATSFFPAKPLGCYGDGGAVFTDNEKYVELLKSYRVHGMGADRYENVRIGINGRLDTIQAAILLVKMDILADEINKRQVVAKRYREGIKNAVHQRIPDGLTSAWAQYSILVDNRDNVQAQLKKQGIPTMVYYPIPVHKQKAYVSYAQDRAFPVSDMLSQRILSLPMHPYLDEKTQDFIITEVNKLL